MRISVLLTAIALTTVPVTVAAAQKSPEKIKLSERSKDGAVLIRVPVAPVSYSMQFSKNGNSGFMSRVYTMNVQPGAPGLAYIARTLSPGTYRLDSVWQQGSWSVCLEKGTFEFTVVPGKVAYLGELRVDRMLRTIQNEAVGAGRTTVRGTDYFMARDQAAGDIVEGRDSAGLVAARTFADQVMNQSGALTELAAMRETSFGTSGLGKTIKICG